jgi:hypothetical protein
MSGYTPDELAVIHDDFAAGIPLTATAAKLGRSHATVVIKANSMGLRRRGPRGSFRRYSSRDRDTIRKDYAAFVPAEEIARKLNRSYGSIRQQIHHMGLHRHAWVARALTWAPEHLQDLLGTVPEEEWLRLCYEWRAGRKQDARGQRQWDRERREQVLATVGAAILAYRNIGRDQKIVAMRVAGLTFEAIGQRVGLTHQRVRQIVVAAGVPALRPKREGA